MSYKASLTLNLMLWSSSPASCIYLPNQLLVYQLIFSFPGSQDNQWMDGTNPAFDYHCGEQQVLGALLQWQWVACLCNVTILTRCFSGGWRRSTLYLYPTTPKLSVALAVRDDDSSVSLT